MCASTGTLYSAAQKKNPNQSKEFLLMLCKVLRSQLLFSKRRVLVCCRRFSATLPAAQDSQPQAVEYAVPKELQFFTDFAQSEFDLHYSLLQEAHRKHGVYLNVPPQLPPAGTPPEVPDVVFCAAQSERLKQIKLAYEPTHGPPPLQTAGTRGLEDISQSSSFTSAPAAGSIATPRATAAGAPPVLPASGSADSMSEPIQKELKRRDVELDKRFHCSVCGKPFRMEISAQHHVKEMHSGAAASVVPGPGPGELIAVEEERPPPTPAGKGTASAAPAPVAGAATPAATLKVEYKKLTALLLPTDEEIDGLLCDVWDPRGKELGGDAFSPMSDVVVGIADDRKPVSEQDLKAMARATPLGVAPGVRRAAAMTNTTGKFVPLKELSARFPNPFGDSAEAKLLAQLKDEPLNPFLPLASMATGHDSQGLVPGSPNFTHARDARPYACHLCAKSFRLLDALVDHAEVEHDVELTQEQLEELHGAAQRRNPFIVQKEKGTGLAASDDGGAAAGAGAPPSGCSGEGLTETETSALPPTPVVEADVSVHLRAVNNTTLLGEVVDVQNGFVKSSRTTQYVVRTSDMSTYKRRMLNAMQRAAPTEGSSADNAPSVVSDENTEDDEVEFHVVRAVGDHMKYATDQIRVGTKIMASGVLRMNRHVDQASRRSHAYPFVLVSAPLGSIVIVDL